MACAGLFGFVRSSPRHRPLPALPHEDRVDETCSTASTRVLRKQIHVRAVAADTRGTGATNSVSHPTFALHLTGLLNRLDRYEVSPRSRDNRGQRKLKKVADVVRTQDVSTVL